MALVVFDGAKGVILRHEGSEWLQQEISDGGRDTEYTTGGPEAPGVWMWQGRLRPHWIRLVDVDEYETEWDGEFKIAHRAVVETICCGPEDLASMLDDEDLDPAPVIRALAQGVFLGESRWERWKDERAIEIDLDA
jgi:hypothetical protein